jgi:hypothetical protein
LVSHGADQNIANNRGETPLTLAEYLQPDQQQSFINVLTSKYIIPKKILLDKHSKKTHTPNIPRPL